MKDHPFISPIICLICGEELKELYPAVEENSYNMVDSGVVGKLFAPFGSENDGTVYQIGLCDKCIKSLVEQKKLKEIGDYLFPELDKEIKENS